MTQSFAAQDCGQCLRITGAIVVESERGCGATFRVFLPVDRSARLTEPVALAGRHRHVLVVDDDALVLGMVTRMLRKDGSK